VSAIKAAQAKIRQLGGVRVFFYLLLARHSCHPPVHRKLFLQQHHTSHHRPVRPTRSSPNTLRQQRKRRSSEQTKEPHQAQGNVSLAILLLQSRCSRRHRSQGCR
jgi:hypothetical protein